MVRTLWQLSPPAVSPADHCALMRLPRTRSQASPYSRQRKRPQHEFRPRMVIIMAYWEKWTLLHNLVFSWLNECKFFSMLPNYLVIDQSCGSKKLGQQQPGHWASSAKSCLFLSNLKFKRSKKKSKTTAWHSACRHHLPSKYLHVLFDLQFDNSTLIDVHSTFKAVLSSLWLRCSKWSLKCESPS